MKNEAAILKILAFQNFILLDNDKIALYLELICAYELKNKSI